MFGVPKSINILKKINSFCTSDKNQKKYRLVIAPPNTLIKVFSKYFENKKLIIGSQNSYYKEKFSSDTGAISPYMLKSVGAKYAIIGHSDNRKEGDTDKILREKVRLALKNNLKVIFCIGENKSQKKKNKTFKVLRSQLTKGLIRKFNRTKIVVAYEPIWSIGSGKIPSAKELSKTADYIKKVLKKIFKKSPAVLYGGSVDGNNIRIFKEINGIDGFLIGGASKSSKKFIDIIKNYYR